MYFVYIFFIIVSIIVLTVNEVLLKCYLPSISTRYTLITNKLIHFFVESDCFEYRYDFPVYRNYCLLILI